MWPFLSDYMLNFIKMSEINAILAEHGNDSDSALATKLFTTIQSYVTTNPTNINEIEDEVYLKLR